MSRIWPGPVLSSILTSIIPTVVFMLAICVAFLSLTVARQCTRVTSVSTLISKQRIDVIKGVTLLIVVG